MQPGLWPNERPQQTRDKDSLFSPLYTRTSPTSWLDSHVMALIYSDFSMAPCSCQGCSFCLIWRITQFFHPQAIYVWFLFFWKVCCLAPVLSEGISDEWGSLLLLILSLALMLRRDYLLRLHTVTYLQFSEQRTKEYRVCSMCVLVFLTEQNSIDLWPEQKRDFCMEHLSCVAW